MHVVGFNVVVPFQFPVFEADEYTPKSDLTNASFTVTVMKNNAFRSASSYTITSITELDKADAPGIYGGDITFPEPGKWSLKIAYPAGTARYAEDYDVRRVAPDDLPQGRALL